MTILSEVNSKIINFMVYVLIIRKLINCMVVVKVNFIDLNMDN